MKRCTHSDSFVMPDVPGRTTSLGRCRNCGRDFDVSSGLLVTFAGGVYLYQSSRLAVP